MNEEQKYHLIDLLEIRMSDTLRDTFEFRIMSDSQKLEAIAFDRDLIVKLKELNND